MALPANGRAWNLIGWQEIVVTDDFIAFVSLTNPRRVFCYLDGLLLRPRFHLGRFLLQLIRGQFLSRHRSKHRRDERSVEKTIAQVLVGLDVVNQRPHLAVVGSLVGMRVVDGPLHLQSKTLSLVGNGLAISGGVSPILFRDADRVREGFSQELSGTLAALWQFRDLAWQVVRRGVGRDGDGFGFRDFA